MPIVQLVASNPFVDGRQSDRAMAIRRGLEIYFEQTGHAVLPEVTLKSGRRADLLCLSPKGAVTIVEIKSSIADFRADTKWPDYREDCDQLFFATLADVPADIFPADAGLLVADEWGAESLRDAPQEPMSAARRKRIMLIFSRTAAQRLSRCCAHAGLDSPSLD